MHEGGEPVLPPGSQSALRQIKKLVNKGESVWVRVTLTRAYKQRPPPATLPHSPPTQGACAHFTEAPGATWGRLMSHWEKAAE